MRLLLCLPVLLLAACGDKPGTTITFDQTTKAGNDVKARADGASGQVTIDAPGFKANVSLPKISLNADKLDFSGVRLFPGSQVTGMDIATDDTKGSDAGKVRIAFAAPGEIAAVRDWFGKQMAAHGFTAKADGQGLSGTTDEGAPFRLELTPAADGKTTGIMVIKDDK